MVRGLKIANIFYTCGSKVTRICTVLFRYELAVSNPTYMYLSMAELPTYRVTYILKYVKNTFAWLINSEWVWRSG